jgi:hypothetical protein
MDADRQEALALAVSTATLLSLSEARDVVAAARGALPEAEAVRLLSRLQKGEIGRAEVDVILTAARMPARGIQDSTRTLMRQAATLPFSEIVKLTGVLTFEELKHMVGAPNWGPETEAKMYRQRWFTLKLREQEGEARP